MSLERRNRKVEESNKHGDAHNLLSSSFLERARASSRRWKIAANWKNCQSCGNFRNGSRRLRVVPIFRARETLLSSKTNFPTDLQRGGGLVILGGLRLSRHVSGESAIYYFTALQMICINFCYKN